MAGPSDLEQLMLELVNETRLDPMGNAARYITSYAPLLSSDPRIQSAISGFAVDGAALLAAYSALVPVGPLAWNDALGTAAEKHSAAMIATQTQTHQATGELGLGARIQAEGYNYYSVGENVYAYSANPLFGHAGFMIDWGYGAGGMQSPAGHRINMMNATYTEIGIDITAETTSANPLGPQVVTEDLGNRGKLFILGVAYRDTDLNRFYSVGEGRADLVVQTAQGTANSTSSGGYALETTSGTRTVTLTGGGLTSALTVSATIRSENLKLDVIDGNVLQSSGSVTVSGPIGELRALSARGLELATGDGVQTIAGGSGNDFLRSGAGADRLSGGAGADNLEGGAGADRVEGGDGSDIASYGNATAGVRASLANAAVNSGDAAGDTFVSIEGLSGSWYGDDLIGDGNANQLWGAGGEDVLWGQGGNDELYGNDGNDWLIGGIGADKLDGGNGWDTVRYSYAATGLRADLQDFWGNTGDAAGDTYFGAENVVGSDWNDLLLGDNSANEVWGDYGDDHIWGRGGNDVLAGGNGVDTFHFTSGWGADRLLDYKVGGAEKLSFDGIAGLTSFSQLTLTDAAAGLTVSYGGNSILLQGIHTLSAGDCLFG